ncbi:hypothetical protein GFH30_05020 [Acinetobacter wanghuae]|uniref:Uncharacterized protein n=1 Tax=Acinetobacter wanghuae TaxID=2662362 RepID=A0A5Q0P2F5_9GAMM|nr:hypothetical protein [Acinetobacter wanghuae]MQW92898.1 hypothetical protein [Acinetobacter wanghuae]QGA10792.1 hypothetical protein GFH30_05020 [Acinetobacter wanghuae]
MKKILALVFAFIGSVANAQYIATNDLKKDFPAESYKTTKPTIVDFEIMYSNTFEADENTEIFPETDKNGIYTDAVIKLKALPSKTFPKKTLVVYDDLSKILKINDKDIIQKFKSISKKQDYLCTVTGQMNAQFHVHYDGRDDIRFRDSVNAEIKSATLIGKPKTVCQKV